MECLHHRRRRVLSSTSFSRTRKWMEVEASTHRSCRCLMLHRAFLVLSRHLCVCIYVYGTYVHVQLYACRHMCAGSNVEVKNQHQVFSSILSTLFSEAKFLTEPGAHKFGHARWPMNTMLDPSVSTSLALGCASWPGFLWECWRKQTLSLMQSRHCCEQPCPQSLQWHLLTTQ